MKLPIAPHLMGIALALEHHPIVCVMANTGSGKSSLIPVHLATYSSHNKLRVIVACPTIVAARSLYKFVSHLNPGVRFGIAAAGEVRYNDRTQVVYCTAGHLARLLMRRASHPRKRDEPLGFDILMLDESHTVSHDYEAVEYLVKYVWRRRDFRLLISSATMSVESIENRWGYLGPMQTISVEVPMYPIKESFEKKSFGTAPGVNMKGMMKEIVSRIVVANKALPVGHFLVFLPGAGDIETLYTMLYERSSLANTEVFPIYSQLPEDEIEEAMRQTVPEPHDTFRAILLSTDMLETSVTIPGIVLVIDSGLQKVVHSMVDGVTTKLMLSQSSSFATMQRRGRTGRTNKGFVHHMFTKAEFIARNLQYDCAIVRNPPHKLVLETLSFGLDPTKIFTDHVDKMLECINYLQHIDLLDDELALSDEAESVAHMPIDLSPALLLHRVCVRFEYLSASESSASSAAYSSRGVHSSFASKIPREPLLRVIEFLLPTRITLYEFMATITGILSATLQGAQGAFFYIPRRGRDESSKEYKENVSLYKDNHFERFRCASDIASCINVMVTMFREVCYDKEKRPKRRGKSRGTAFRFTRWSVKNGMNNKTLRGARSIFRRVMTHLDLDPAPIFRAMSSLETDLHVSALIDDAVALVLPTLLSVCPDNVYFQKNRNIWFNQRSINPKVRKCDRVKYKLGMRNSMLNTCDITCGVLALNIIHLQNHGTRVSGILSMLVPLEDDVILEQGIKQGIKQGMLKVPPPSQPFLSSCDSD